MTLSNIFNSLFRVLIVKGVLNWLQSDRGGGVANAGDEEGSGEDRSTSGVSGRT